ncbi:MAG: tail fiber protein [Anaerolineae bacterium]|nr:tail fiber protein [Anaerolineae bacterium]
MDPFIAEIKLFAGNFAPQGWAFCEGQILPIMQYQALFSLLGTTYGGDGRTTFALPDLRGRAPIHPAAGSYLGQKGGGIDVDDGDDIKTTATLNLNYIIALQGTFPSRG